VGRGLGKKEGEYQVSLSTREEKEEKKMDLTIFSRGDRGRKRNAKKTYFFLTGKKNEGIGGKERGKSIDTNPKPWEEKKKKSG